MGDITLRLGAFGPEYSRSLARWVNDPDATRWLATGRLPMTPTEALTTWGPGPDRVVYLIQTWDVSSALSSLWRPIGVCGLWDIDWLSRKGELRVLLGEIRGSGLGARACRMLLEIAFLGLGLERVWLGTAAPNVAARKCFKRVGFREEGVRRRDLCRNGEWIDNVMMAILREEWGRDRAGDIPG